MTILIVEDDEILRYNLENAFTLEGYKTMSCADGDTGLFYIKENVCDLILLDWMLPGKNAPEILRQARTSGIMTPVLLLTALSSIGNKVEGLDCGADDYLSKPFDMRELLARVRALIRRPAPIEPLKDLALGDITLDMSVLLLTGPKCSVAIPKRLGELIELFLQNGGGTLSRHTIFARVWGLESDVENGIIESYISYFRRRLNHVGSNMKIHTIRGVGYSLCENED